jgi:hypothetical protein
MTSSINGAVLKGSVTGELFRLLTIDIMVSTEFECSLRANRSNHNFIR